MRNPFVVWIFLTLLMGLVQQYESVGTTKSPSNPALPSSTNTNQSTSDDEDVGDLNANQQTISGSLASPTGTQKSSGSSLSSLLSPTTTVSFTSIAMSTVTVGSSTRVVPITSQTPYVNDSFHDLPIDRMLLLSVGILLQIIY
ncbi:hypothetical protein K7432_002246 [Basidiobolus ranarum]|uniref:Uncharacterized protein n=1 Tax=Basidiobolus ranarum TaxID=34480 RepID=A0ABR2X239_9FUNG